VLVALRDISERKAAEQGLKDSEQRFRAYVEQAGDALFVHDLQGRLIDINEQACSDLGYSRDEMLRMNVLDLETAFDLEAAQGFWESLQPGTPVTIYGEHRRKDGSVFPAEIRVGCFALAGERRYLAIARDITERKAAEQALKESEQRLQNIITASPVPMVITRISDGRVLFANAELREMFGFDDDLEILQAMTPEHYVRQEARAEMLRQLKSAGFFKGEIEYRRLNGDYFWALVSARVIQFGSEPALIGLLVDMTEQRLLEEQFRQAQKMESVGTLVGGIAHDFNNMLAGMLGQLYLVRHELQEGELGAENVGKMVERINAVDNQGRLAADVIAQLMTFARKGQVVMERLDVNQLVTDAMRLHRVSIPENIVIRAHLGDALAVQGDAGLIQQMLLNLLTNARDAVQGETAPQVDISLSSFMPDPAFLKAHREFADIAYACLEVRDNGCGMDAQQVGRIFDPFFTTKPVGKGTGLGLAMLYGAMKTHGGAVLVDSKPGEGSCFRLFFPQLEGGGVESVREEERLARGSGQTILLVDDEAVLIDVIGQSLQLIGYRLLTAHDGEEAVRLFSEHQHEVDLAILDVVMPVKGGIAAAIEIRELSAELPIIFHTGYGEEADLGAVKDWESCVTLRKPVNIEHLSRIIAEMLDGE